MIDEIAREYLVLGLSLGELEDGTVDAYYGPPEIHEQAKARRLTPARLTDEAAALRARLADEVGDVQRRRWLDRQLTAIETLARRTGGAEIPYVEEVERCFDASPQRTPPETLDHVRIELDELLPGNGSLRERLDARDARLTIPREHIKATLDSVTAELREFCVAQLPIPIGETLDINLVSNKPWSAYNWYDGELRSRVEFNTDLPTRAHAVVGTLGHETFPGHHLEHAWKEQRLLRERGYGEASLHLINTPEAYISEGLAEVGPRLLLDAERWQGLLLGVCERAGMALRADDAAREWAINEAMRPLRGIGGDAALMLHADDRPLDEVRRFLIEDGLQSPARAEKNIAFIHHPLWRTYVFCYAGGEQLLTDWCAAAGDETARRTRFVRLLTEQLTPSGIAEELSAA